MNSLQIPVDIRRFPWVKKLAADYAFQFAALAPFFSGDPAAPAAWSSAIASAQRHPRQRAEMSALLTTQLERRNAPAAARAAAVRLAEPNTVAVVTGQQAGLFGGPLFTLYKGLTAAKLAARITQEHGVPAVAVFWVESEDHDWDEVASVSVLDNELQRRTITLPAPAGAGQSPIGAIQVGSEIHGTLDELASVLPQTEFTAGLLEDLRQRLHAGQRHVRRLRSRARPHAGRPRRDRIRVLRPLGEAACARDLRARNRAPRPHVGARGRSRTTARRRGVPRASRGLVRKRARRYFGLTALEPRWRSQMRRPWSAKRAIAPKRSARTSSYGRLSKTRCFPTVTYVSGPNELAYLGQLRDVYAQFGVPMPLMYPRASATVLDSAGARFLEKARPSVRGAAGPRRVGVEPPPRRVAARVGRSGAERSRRSHRGKNDGDRVVGPGHRCHPRRRREDRR